MISFLTKTTFLLLLLPTALLAATPTKSLQRADIERVVEKTVASRPVDREVLFVGLVFMYLDKTVLFDTDALKTMIDEIEGVKASRFERKFDADPKFQSWMLQGLQDLVHFNKTKTEDLRRLAQKMTDASLDMNDALEYLNRRQLLFLIQYASQRPPQTQLASSPRKITIAQLLEVLRTEQNQRVSGRS